MSMSGRQVPIHVVLLNVCEFTFVTLLQLHTHGMLAEGNIEP